MDKVPSPEGFYNQLVEKISKGATSLNLTLRPGFVANELVATLSNLSSLDLRSMVLAVEQMQTLEERIQAWQNLEATIKKAAGVKNISEAVLANPHQQFQVTINNLMGITGIWSDPIMPIRVELLRINSHHVNEDSLFTFTGQGVPLGRFKYGTMIPVADPTYGGQSQSEIVDYDSGIDTLSAIPLITVNSNFP